MTKKDITHSLEKIVDISKETIVEKRQVENNNNKIYIVVLYSTIIQYAQAVIGSLKSNDLIAIPTVFRSLFEAYIDLINLCKYENYHCVLYANYLGERIKMLEATFKNPKNPYFKDTIEQINDIGGEIKKLRSKLNEAQKEISKFDGDVKQIKTRFRLAGLEEIYTGIYKLLCQDSHNDLLRLESRHLKDSEIGLTVSMNTNWDLKDVAPHILTTIGIIKMSLEKVFEKLEYGEPKEYLNQIESNEEDIKPYLGREYT